MTLDELLVHVRAVDALPLEERFAELARLHDAARRDHDIDSRRARAAVSSAEEVLFSLAKTDGAARRALHEAVAATPWSSERIAALGALDDEATYQLVRDNALRQLDLPYGQTMTAWLFALGSFAQRDRFANGATEVLLGGFDQLATHARTNETLVNQVAFGALAFIVPTLRDSSVASVLQRAFRIASGETETENFYELNVACGALAIALSAVECRAAAGDLEHYLDKFQFHDGEVFMAQVRYALWTLEDDGAGALACLRDPKTTRGLGTVAAAIADLDYQPGRAVLTERAARLTNPIASEAFAEAIARLDLQVGPPLPEHRMIWMFGRRSRYEIANGELDDNVFVQRAIVRTNQPELGVVCDLDDSAPAD